MDLLHIDYLHEGKVSIEVRFFFGRESDIDSRLKCLLDSLQGILYADDKQVYRLVVDKDKDTKNPRAELVVKDLEG